MSALRKIQPATWEDVVAAPEHMSAELIDGELTLLPRPAMRHGRATLRIARALGDPDGDDLDGWFIAVEPELHLGQPDPRTLVLVPDLAGWRSERAQGLADVVAVELVPDWICEILSPGTHRYDRLVKMDRYARLGVAWAWLVDPVEAVLEVYRLHEGAWLRVQSASGDEELTVLPFEVPVRLAGWFSR